MNYNKPTLLMLALAFCHPFSALASGYSEYQNYRIWQLRTAAAQQASQLAQKKCNWAPEIEFSFSDQLPGAWSGIDKDLFLRIMAMLRLDQNARAISSALKDSTAKARVQDVDAENLIALKDIISKHGFPAIATVGQSGADAMLLLVAHADQDLAFQKLALRAMNDAVANNQLPGHYPTMLKSIRPRIEGATPAPESDTPTNQPAKQESSRACYQDSRQQAINTYIREQYLRSGWK